MKDQGMKPGDGTTVVGIYYGIMILVIGYFMWMGRS